MPTSTTPDAARLLGFYQGEADGPPGVRIDSIWNWDHRTLEERHDFIQWLFPTIDPSWANFSAPALDEASMAAFRSEPGLRRRVLRSLRVMLDFYGLRLDDSAPEAPAVARNDQFPERKENWLANRHNHLRISRILASLNALGLPEHAHAFFTCLSDIYDEERGRIDETTFAYWQARAGE